MQGCILHTVIQTCLCLHYKQTGLMQTPLFAGCQIKFLTTYTAQQQSAYMYTKLSTYHLHAEMAALALYKAETQNSEYRTKYFASPQSIQ